MFGVSPMSSQSSGNGPRPATVRTAARYVAVAAAGRVFAHTGRRAAERGMHDLVTIDDTFGIQTHRAGVPDDRLDEVRGRLDALLIASLVAPLTSRIGLVPAVSVTHTEPFHVAKATATLDHTS